MAAIKRTALSGAQRRAVSWRQLVEKASHVAAVLVGRVHQKLVMKAQHDLGARVGLRAAP